MPFVLMIAAAVTAAVVLFFGFPGNGLLAVAVIALSLTAAWLAGRLRP